MCVYWSVCGFVCGCMRLRVRVWVFAFSGCIRYHQYPREKQQTEPIDRERENKEVEKEG